MSNSRPSVDFAPSASATLDDQAPEIERENVARFVVALLDGPTRIIALEGGDGAGKTTFLRQFARDRADRTCAVFVNPASRWAYDKSQIAAELCTQIQRKLDKDSLLPNTIVDDAILQRNINWLARKASIEEKPYYFVLDGLLDLPENDESARRQLIDLLPFGIEQFRFILSGDLDRLPLSEPARRFTKAYPLIYFTREECERYLGNLPIDKPSLTELYNLTNGIPAKLASVRRILSRVPDPGAKIPRLPEALRELFRLEWESVSQADELQNSALGILAYENRAYKVAEIASILSTTPETIVDKLGGLGFVKCEPDNVVRFESESYRRFVAEELAPLRPALNDLFIDYYVRNPDSDEALTNLSSYLVSATKLKELVEYLSPERFARLYQRAPSLRLVQDKADQGRDAARALKRDGDLVRFTVQKCTIEQLAQSEIAVAEIRARTTLGDYDTAFALAEAASRIEVRIRLLAAVSRARKEAGLADDPLLQERIRELLSQLQSDAMRDQVFAAASDLFYTAPDLAIELVSGQASPDASDRAIDWALAQLAMQAHLTEKDPNASKRAWAIAERIQDPTAKRFSTETSFILGRLTAEEAIHESKKLDGTRDRLYVLQRWMRSNRDRSDAVDVLDYGLKLSLQATQYTADARACRELAICLPYVKDVHRLSYFISIIDGQKTVLERQGPTAEFVRLQLLLARAEWQHDRIAAQDRLTDVYNDLDHLKDPVVRTASLARFAAALSRLDPERSLDDKFGLHELVEVDLQSGIDNLLSLSADHVEMLEGVIQALALRRSALCLEIVGRMNTEWRRDLGHQEFIEALTAMPIGELNIACLLSALHRIVDPRVRDATMHSFVYGLMRRRLSEEDIERLLPVLSEAVKMQSGILRTATEARAVRIVGKYESTSIGEAKQHLLKEAKCSWQDLDDDWQKLIVGFNLVADIAECSPKLATETVSEVNALKERLVLQDHEAADAARLGMRLAIRAFGGLLSRNFDAKEDFERLFAVIVQCGGIEDQAELLSDLATRCALADRPNECKQIVEQRLVPLLYSATDHDTGRKYELIRSCAPALYAGASNTAFALLSELPEVIRDEALFDIASYILTKVSSTEPFEAGARIGFDISFEDANAIVAVMEQMTTDSSIYSLIETLADSIAGSTYKQRLNRHQKADLIRQLEDIAAKKFPNPRFIQHNGYVIAAAAQINRIREREDIDGTEKLLAAARALPNLSDKAFVVAIVGATRRTAKARRVSFEEARQIADSIPILEERVDRYRAIGTIASASELDVSKAMLKKAIVLCASGTGASIDERRRSLIDYAYRLDSTFASALVVSMDDDPAKDQMDKQLRLNRLQDTFAEKKHGVNDVHVESAREVAKVAWMRLGALNANRLPPVPNERALPVLDFAASQSMSDAYPIFAWFTQNAIRRSANTGTLREYVLPLYEAYLRGAELAIRANARSYAQTSRVLAFAIPLSGAGQAGSVDDGDREGGLTQLREWLRDVKPSALHIVEPYFAPKDVAVLALIRDSVEDCEVIVLTGRHGSLSGVSAPYESAYRDAWSRLRSGDPPDTLVIFAGSKQTDKFPIHDRWWLAADSGIHLGTSFSGLGSRISSVRVLDSEEAKRMFRELMPIFTQSRVEFEGERLAYSSFSL